MNLLESIVCPNLNSSVTAEVEIKLSGVSNADINSGPRRNIATLATLTRKIRNLSNDKAFQTGLPFRI